MEQHRLVTVTGPGGTGKTRLAGEVARADMLGADVAVIKHPGFFLRLGNSPPRPLIKSLPHLSAAFSQLSSRLRPSPINASACTCVVDQVVICTRRAARPANDVNTQRRFAARALECHSRLRAIGNGLLQF